jgi:hypothetical protein
VVKRKKCAAVVGPAQQPLTHLFHSARDGSSIICRVIHFCLYFFYFRFWFLHTSLHFSQSLITVIAELWWVVHYYLSCHSFLDAVERVSHSEYLRMSSTRPHVVARCSVSALKQRWSNDGEPPTGLWALVSDSNGLLRLVCTDALINSHEWDETQTLVLAVHPQSNTWRHLMWHHRLTRGASS